MNNVNLYRSFFNMIFMCILMLNCFVAPHGFSRDTFIALAHNTECMSIEHIASSIDQRKHYISSYDTHARQFVKNRVKAARTSQDHGYCILSFNQLHAHDISCSPSQQFYRVLDHAWIAAHKLNKGDVLLCGNNTSCEVVSVTFVDKPINIYALEIKNTHTFLVGRQRLVTHNMILPMITIVGLSTPISISCGGSIGATLGPIGICSGMVIGAAIGYAIKACLSQKKVDYKPLSNINEAKRNYLNNDAQIDNDAQAPGKPTEKDGFVPKKKWDGKKVKNPNGPGYGWPDKNGEVWIPTGPNGHGCPHWDVEDPNGDYRNVVPGGRIRGQK